MWVMFTSTFLRLPQWGARMNRIQNDLIGEETLNKDLFLFSNQETASVSVFSDRDFDSQTSCGKLERDSELVA